MTPADLDAAEKLAAEATAGEWTISTAMGGHGVLTLGVFSNGEWVADCHNRGHDAVFIADAHSIVPALVAECRRLTAERDEARRERDAFSSDRLYAETRDAIAQRDHAMEQARVMAHAAESEKADRVGMRKLLDAAVAERDAALAKLRQVTEAGQ